MAALIGAIKIGMPMPMPGRGRLIRRQIRVTIAMPKIILKGSTPWVKIR